MLGDFASLDVQNTYRGSDAYGLHQALDNSDFVIVAEGSNVEDIAPLEQKYHPDILILNIQMRRVALDIIKEILEIYPKQLIIVSAESDNDDYIERAMGVGAVGYFVQEHTVPSLPTVLKNIMLNRAIR
ncbi:Protease production enhancer protein [Piscirickettsia salmonis]|nr:Protease production enhancer protein [Piscirickettsia salmonis]QGP60352.1 Protease production enhancer protein [Piscirickettsia salmonis]QGP63311.1 Protease production enhancer protein [Piscirickettsia salmonis]